RRLADRLRPLTALVPRLPLAGGRVRATRPAGVLAELDRPAADPGVLEPVPGVPRQVGRQLDEREVRADRDRPEVTAVEAVLLGQRTYDLPWLDAVLAPDVDAVRRESRGGLRITITGRPGRLGLGVEQQRLVALQHDGQRRGHVDVRDVVLAD